MEEIKQLDDAEEILKLPNSWEERGIEKGIEKGKIEERQKIAMEMLKSGASVEFIKKVTELTEEEIENIRKSL